MAKQRKDLYGFLTAQIGHSTTHRQLLDDWLAQHVDAGHDFTKLLCLLGAKAETSVDRVACGVRFTAQRPFDDLAAAVSLFVLPIRAESSERARDFHVQRFAG